VYAKIEKYTAERASLPYEEGGLSPEVLLFFMKTYEHFGESG
jgi:hypothetical protein